MSNHKPASRGSETYIIAGIGLLLIIIVGAIIAFDKSGKQPSSVSGTATLHIGDQAPPFSLPARGGGTTSLNQYDGKPVLLYFNEGVGCSACWQQIITLEHDQAFMNKQIPLLTITPDSLNLWDAIVKANPIQSPIVSDSDNSVSREYGMLTMQSSMHGGMRPGHTFVLIDKDHNISWIGDYPQMNVSAKELVSVMNEKR